MARPKFGRVVRIVLLYGAFALGFSFVGYVALPPAIHFHEYSFPEAILEVGGHFAFGAIAALPLRDVESSLVCGSFAVVIDADHLLAALNLSISSRPDHSIAFAVIATSFIWALARKRPAFRMGMSALRIAAIVPASLLAHLSYDVLAAYVIFQSRGFSFPLLAPFDFTLIGFPFWLWFPLEAIALAFVYLMVRLD